MLPWDSYTSSILNVQATHSPGYGFTSHRVVPYGRPPMLLGESLRPTAVTQDQLTVRGIRVTIHLAGKEWGLSAFLSLGERLVLKLDFRFLTRLRLPSPSVGKKFRRPASCHPFELFSARYSPVKLSTAKPLSCPFDFPDVIMDEVSFQYLPRFPFGIRFL
jgi:hypothetical protein